MKNPKVSKSAGFILVATAVLAFSAIAKANISAQQTITVVVHPFVASLSSNAQDIESALAEKAASVCGSLENVARLDEVNLRMRKATATVNPQGTAGAETFSAILDLHEPRVEGTAIVVCKN